MERLTFTAEVLPDPLATVRAALAAMTDDELGPLHVAAEENEYEPASGL